MEVILNCGDKINIPDGCKAEIKDGVITIEKEVEKFKNGDILAYVGCTDNTSTFIYKGEDENGSHKYYAGITIYNKLSISDDRVDRWGRKEVRLATEEEKQYLFDKMAEQGLRWNAEDKEIEKIRWRATRGEIYFIINLHAGYSVESSVDYYDKDDNEFYKSFNYFKMKEDAKKATELVKATLKKFHEENKQDEKDNVQ